MLTTTRAAAILGINPRTLRAHIKAGHVKAEMQGRDWYITPEEVARFAREKRAAHRPKKGTPSDTQD